MNRQKEHQQKTQQKYDPNRLLDALMLRLGANSDKALSRKLKIAGQLIRNIRAGCVPIGASMLLRMSDIAGASVDELRTILGDQRAKFRLNCRLNCAG